MSTPVYLGRQPILDTNQKLVAFELLFRSSSHNAAQFIDGTHATASVVASTFGELGIGNALGCRRGFINVDEHFLLDDAVMLLPPTQVVLELLESITATPEVIARCEALKEAGFLFALDDLFSLDDPRASLLPLVSIVKIDLPEVDPAALPALVKSLRNACSAKLLAEKVDSAEQLQTCQALGIDYFQGYYFAKPAVLQGKRLDSSKLALLKLLTQIIEDADTAVLENSFKQAPALTINLLRLVNSVATGLRVRISSLRHAITVLGRRQLQRWLQLLLYTDPTGEDKLSENPLLQLAATRGRLMELLAKQISPHDDKFADHAFMCGVMSLTPTLFDKSLEEVLEQVSLSSQICDALRSHHGRLGELLALTEAMEQEDTTHLQASLLPLPMLHTETLSASLAEALSWANAIGEENPEND